MTETPNRNRFNFANNLGGHAFRNILMNALTASGIAFEAGKETLVFEGGTFILLTLTVQKRPNEGQIAQKMKNRKLNEAKNAL